MFFKINGLCINFSDIIPDSSMDKIIQLVSDIKDPTFKIVVIGKQFKQASYWTFVAVILATIGFTHQYTFNFADTVSMLNLQLNDWFWSYLIIAIVLYITPWIANESKEAMSH